MDDLPPSQPTHALYVRLQLTCWACHNQRDMTLLMASIGPSEVPRVPLRFCCHRCGCRRMSSVVTEKEMTTGLPL
jgi:hypothetical protein